MPQLFAALQELLVAPFLEYLATEGGIVDRLICSIDFQSIAAHEEAVEQLFHEECTPTPSATDGAPLTVPSHSRAGFWKKRFGIDPRAGSSKPCNAPHQCSMFLCS